MTVSEHGAGDGQEPVGDGAESACMGMTTASQGGVLGAAGLVVLHGDACPVVDGVRETRMAGVAPDDDPALAGSLRDGATPVRLRARRRSRAAAEDRMLLRAAWRRRSFPLPAGSEDLHVVLLPDLPRCGSASGTRRAIRRSSLM